ncbi:quinone oxidoreductase [Demequina capsici]|uniref:Quinone oxidoreductase n=1 Tax=Demequina capsici TaxID=3075620 RepID=A0AA96F9C9_9MICO|nr:MULTISPECIES: quinone oxidoreductase [unclassified Demequina]WNM23270.1 quinone oxidoreductase [Demequina sp. OYTSA14]WNM26148.1 quinone oxidoreductase [Demequina sp. PMTSA13]
MKAIQVHHVGGVEALTLADIPEPAPRPGRVLVRAAALGVNFIDTYHRSGAYPMPLPFVPGREGAGTVTHVGDGVEGFTVGDRVAWGFAPASYAEVVSLSPDDLYRVPADVPLDTAAAAMLQGLTAHYLVTSVHRVEPGDTVLVHAAAGGVGLLLTQMARSRGARVLGTVSTDEKESLASQAGAEVIRYDRMTDLTAEIPAAVRALTGGEGVHAVYDGVGRTTFDGSLASLRPRGMMALFGAASGPVPPFDLQRLNAGGSLMITRPTLGHFVATPQERAWRGSELLGAIADGSLHVRIGATYPLADAGAAHAALEGRQTTGKVLLLP